MCRSLAFKNSLGEPLADRNLPGSSSLQSFQAWLRKGRDRAPASLCWQHWWICVWMSRQCCGSRQGKVYVSFPRPQIALAKGSMSVPLRTVVSPMSELIQTVFCFSTQSTSRFDIRSLIPDRSLFCCLYGIISNYNVPRNARDSQSFWRIDRMVNIH